MPSSNIPKKSNTKQTSTSKISNATVNKDSNDKGKLMEQDVGKEKTPEEAV